MLLFFINIYTYLEALCGDNLKKCHVDKFSISNFNSKTKSLEKKKNEYRYVRNFTHQLSGYIDFSSTKISTDVCGPK